MSEPTSSAGGALLGWKAIGGAAGVAAGGAGLAAIVVMLMTLPRHPREWAVALISTVVGSVGGGAFVVLHFELQAWANSLPGLMAMFGLVFACGLPGWVVVRALFNFTEARKTKGLDELARDAKAGVKDVLS